jgi:hypothetical protein
VDLTQSSEPLPIRSQKRLFRQSVSAGFHTQVLTAARGRVLAAGGTARSIRTKSRPDDELARTE